MNKLFMFLTFIIAILLVDCASAPTRVNGLNLENSGLASGIELNGVLISHGDKFILDKSFRVPTVPHGKETYTLSVSFTDIPAGPWEFNVSTLFPVFNSWSFHCKRRENQRAYDDCDHFNQLESPFIHIDCKKPYTPDSSLTYSERLAEIKREKAKIKRENEYVELTAGDVAGVTIAVAGAVTYMVLVAPVVLIDYGARELGMCAESDVIVWFDHDKFFDTVKEAIIYDYGSINAYVTDIRQASMAYNILANIDKDKREEIKVLIQEWKNSINKLLPENDSIDNYHIRYSPYSLVKIPRKEDWSSKHLVIEYDLLSHYTEQFISINRQLDSYNKTLKQRYGININLSTEAK